MNSNERVLYDVIQGAIECHGQDAERSTGALTLPRYTGPSGSRIYHLVRWVLRAGASYPVCGRGVGSPVNTLASKPEDQILAPLLHALLIRPDGILGRIAPDPAYKVDEQQTLPPTS
jgi:hypothetical protein